jgi:hypothetical protein
MREITHGVTMPDSLRMSKSSFIYMRLARKLSFDRARLIGFHPRMNRKPQASRGGVSRRDFLKTTTLAVGATAFAMPAIVRGKNLNGKINIAAIGIGGKGRSDIDACAGENIVALCDVDEDFSREQRQKYPQAKFFRDFRKMFDAIHKEIDAVIVATPDHFHAVAVAAAIRAGKHIYGQKPLTQTIYEARLLRDLARRHKIISQMGNQGSAADGLRRGVECLQAGIIGDVHEVHVWTNRPIWPQGIARPAGADPIPASLDWDTWIGPAPMRPFKSGVYHPWNWRGWQDFGTGALGDMACHTVNLPFRGLRLGAPTTIEAQSSAMNSETYPLSSTIRFDFPARNEEHHGLFMSRHVLPVSRPMGPVTLWWYDGGKPIEKPDPKNRGGHDGSNKPPREVTADVEDLLGKIPGSGCLMIGSKGKLFSPDDYGTQFFVKLNDEKEFVSADSHGAVAAIPQTIARNRFKGDPDQRHHLEWLAAIRENDHELCYSRFDVAAELTEIMLLGCVALRAGKKLEWDAPHMRAKNAPEIAPLIKRENRKGWSL